MTTTKRPAVRKPTTQIAITSRTVAVRFHGVKIDGWPALFVIAIIMIAKLTVTILRVAWFLACLITPVIIARSAALYVAIRSNLPE